MNKFVIAAAIVVMSSAAFAKHVPLPPKRPADLVPTQTYTLGNGVTVTAPVGTRVDIDKDGRSVDVQLDGPNRGFLSNILPW
jgi:hypothetical protein